MTVPSFLSTGFAFTQIAAATDVQNIIDAVNTMLTTTLSSTPTSVYPSGERWSLGSGILTAPSDNGARFMRLTLIRNSAARLEFKAEDPGGVLYDGEFQINTAGSIVNIFGGPGHLFIEANNNGTWEFGQISMTDPTPEPLASTTVYVYGRVSRVVGGGVAVGNANNVDYWLGRFRAGGTTSVNSPYLMGCRPQMPLQDTTNTHLRTQAGSDVVAPMYIGSDNSNSAGLWLNGNKLYQCAVVDANNTGGSILNIPIDTGITAPFQITHLVAAGICLLAYRKA